MLRGDLNITLENRLAMLERRVSRQTWAIFALVIVNLHQLAPLIQGAQAIACDTWRAL